MAPSVSKLVLFSLSLLLINGLSFVQGETWCVSRSDASNQALLTALDYACGSSADCIPLLSDSLCFLPNTIQAHASYAFNSYYQRRGNAPGSCDFAGTGTVAKTNPSYGSCVYPSSQSTAGGTATPTTKAPNNPDIPPTTITTTASINSRGGVTGLNNPGLVPPFPTTDESNASFDCIVTTNSMLIMILLGLSFILHPIWGF